MEKQALEGIRIADFSWVGVGPVTTKYLADHGAMVVRIESSIRYDGLRSSAPFKDGKKGINRSGYYAYLNCNKYSIAIDLNHELGREVAKRLVKWADVVAESFTPGRMEAWGLGYEDLKKIKEDIIMIRMNSHGLTGPYARHIGLGQLKLTAELNSRRSLIAIQRQLSEDLDRLKLSIVEYLVG